MGANKRLYEEWKRSQWNLSGFPPEERSAWRRLLPEHLASPRLVPADHEIEPLAAKSRRPTLVESVTSALERPHCDPPFDPTPSQPPVFYRVDPEAPRKPPATKQPELF